jgi:hypothetical protein
VPWEHVALSARFYFSPSVPTVSIVPAPAAGPRPQGSEEQARIELTETLPKVLRQAHANVLAIATDTAPK